MSAAAIGTPRSQRRWLWFGITAVAVFVADQVAKIVVRATIEPNERIDLLPGIDLVRTTNKGIAFGFFPGNRAVVALLTVAALLVIGAVLARLATRNRVVALGGGALLGGSIGNLVDRAARDGVTDFLDVSLWPAFNVADIGIVGGAAILAIGLLTGESDRG